MVDNEQLTKVVAESLIQVQFHGSPALSEQIDIALMADSMRSLKAEGAEIERHTKDSAIADGLVVVAHFRSHNITNKQLE